MPIDRESLLRSLRASFLGELGEALAGLEADLVALEGAHPTSPPDAERMNQLLRRLHGLKGAARAASLPLVERLCHALEERLGPHRDRPQEIDRGLADLALGAVDALSAFRAQAVEGRGYAEDLLGPALAALGVGALSGPKPAASAASADGGGEVPRSLDRSLVLSGELGIAHGRLDARLGSLAEVALEVRALGAGGAGTQQVDAERRLGVLERRVRRLQFDLRQDLRLFSALDGELGAQLALSRRVPFGQAAQGLDRVARDVARAGQKQVRLEVVDNGLQLDREVASRLKPALVQLVRNAVDHGLELPARRELLGKDPEGLVRVVAELEGGEVRVTVEDDGRGLDEAALLELAAGRGLAVPVSQQELWRLALSPGVSTAKEVTDVSGRGVGLDLVRERVEGLHGQVRVTSEASRGTRFVLMVPVSAAARRVLVLRSGGQLFGLLSHHVRKVHLADPERISTGGGRAVLLRPGQEPLALGALWALLGLRTGGTGQGRVVELRGLEGEAAVLVDEVLSEEEVVVKGLGPQVRRLRSYTGLGVRQGGQLLALLSADRLVRGAKEGKVQPQFPAAPKLPAPRRRTVLVADDSVTTRTLERSILEAAGYEVLVAADGDEAWRLLLEQGADVLVSDVQMPGLDGFALTRAVRGSRRFAELPVVLVTALGSDQDRKRGLEAGADSYLVKSAFDQTLLLKTLSELLRGER